MSTQFDVHKIIERGSIQNELELEQALIADRKLRLLSKEDPKLKTTRKKLRELIAQYENANWSDETKLNDKKIRESDIAEVIAGKERIFINKRKELIKNRMKSFNINQQQLGLILGHKSKSYISELMNGISPFSLKDLIVIHRLLKIELTDLVPTFLPQAEQQKIKTTVAKLNNPKLKLSQEDLETV